ncbi:MAG: S9 family peptidase, partial [Simkania negevensis]|nr:S9 family peptidase [Simkania negevensis]
LPPPYYARTMVHEYGGGSFIVHQATLYFSNFKDQTFMALSIQTGQIKPLTSGGIKRIANPIFDPLRHLIYAVQEDHLENGKVLNSLVLIDPKGKRSLKTVHSGYDFYSSPALHPKGTHLAFLVWNHPNMPWDGTELWVGKLKKDGSLEGLRQVAGGISESIYQPRWNSQGILYFISDRTDWWNLYRLEEDTIAPCYEEEAEHGVPGWIFGSSRYDFLKGQGEEKIVLVSTIKGIDSLSLIDPLEKKKKKINLPYTNYANLHTCGQSLVFEASSPTRIPAIIKYDLITKKEEILRKSRNIEVDPGYLSLPKQIEFPTEDGKSAFAFYYPPTNKDYLPNTEEKPPLLVKAHGGPSGHITPSLDLMTQFWTSRGFAFLDVNYRGSTGYGRAYREYLKGKWGTIDIDDCISAAFYLIRKQLADPKRLAIRGGSAGGYTALGALAFRNVFQAGASYYGVSDLEGLVKETHKFESRYLDGLVGPYPQAIKRYLAFSPIYFANQIKAPLILFQGSDDKVVLPSQSEKMFEALKKRKIPTAYLLFEGEGHGFRKSETIQATLEAELYFYAKVFHFIPNDFLPSIPIENLGD